MKKYNYLQLLLLCIVFVFVACKKKENEEPTPDDDFDKSGMLTNIGSGIIVSSYQSLKIKVTSLDSASMVFTSNSTTTNLLALREAFKQAYLAWQSVSVFEFGPAENALLRTNSNTFPTDTAQVMINIHSGNYDLSAINNIDAKGFPAIDYLLYSSDTSQLISLYTSDTYASNRKSYLNSLINELKINVNTVYTAWSASGGNYLATFTSSLGSDVGSSLGYIVNQLNYDFETLKNYKIGIPLGKKTLGTPLPDKVEGYYAKNSVELAVAQLKAIQNLYLGKNTQGVDGVGLDDYLIHVKAQYNGGLLSDAIKAQLNIAIPKLESIPSPLAETIVSNPTIVDAAYTELQKLVVLFKTDMPSALGVLITYQDNDGD
ncbi:MAG: imelysin family protein [Bacteroidia bacterium]